MRFSQILVKFAVSLFTREWIEIKDDPDFDPYIKSPSLRGSGLKYVKADELAHYNSLPLYEGVD